MSVHYWLKKKPMPKHQEDELPGAIATEHGLHWCDKCESFGATATEHGCRLSTAVSLHCQLSLAPLPHSMAVVLYSQ